VADVSGARNFAARVLMRGPKPQKTRPQMSIPPPGYEKRQASPESSPPPAPQGAPLSHEDANTQNGSRPADDNRPYELKSVQALRGRESSAKAKWQNQGWEFVSENRGALRTELNFRRVKPKTVGAHLLSVVAAFRGMQPKTRLVLVASCALILVASIIGIAASAQSGGDTPKPSATQTATSTAPSAEPADTSTTGAQPSETASETSEADASASSEPDAERVVTAANSEELAALLKVRDECDQSIASFASKYADTTIEFDGSIANMMNHGDDDTWYDILLAPGNNGPESAVGPHFKFEDVNVFDLNLTRAQAPSAGGRFRFAAKVAEYNPDQCVLLLEPVSTRAR
jgi:hypothetical protein